MGKQQYQGPVQTLGFKLNGAPADQFIHALDVWREDGEDLYAGRITFAAIDGPSRTFWKKAVGMSVPEGGHLLEVEQLAAVGLPSLTMDGVRFKEHISYNSTQFQAVVGSIGFTAESLVDDVEMVANEGNPEIVERIVGKWSQIIDRLSGRLILGGEPKPVFVAHGILVISVTDEMFESLELRGKEVMDDVAAAIGDAVEEVDGVRFRIAITSRSLVNETCKNLVGYLQKVS
jgi:hypothetical protein